MVDASAAYDTDRDTHAKERRLPVIEIFGPTIQGEGAMIGVKTMFVRMGGCDFRCQKCDSMHAVLPQAVHANKTMMTQEEIGQELWRAKKETGVEWVTLSGGNPAIWDLEHLVQICHAMGIQVALETQATVWNDWIRDCDQITLSPKAPGMGEKFTEDVFQEFLNKLRRWPLENRTSLKVVVFSQMDMDFALGIGEQFVANRGREDQLFLSVGNAYPPVLTEDFKLLDQVPAFGLVDTLIREYKILLEDYLQDPRFGSWKFLPQLHVILWGNKAGV